MLWDDDYFYFGADMEEPQVWGTLTEWNSVICRDNDFEIFIDPDGDCERYMEFEINPLNAIWDLYLPKAYNKGGKADHAWDFVGIRHAVQVDGTLNCADDVDGGWTVEVAIPWASMAEYAGTDCPPKAGDAWRVNFSRVEWEFDYHKGGYLRREGPPCDNWVWSPQGVVNMHVPEMWGYVDFSDLASRFSRRLKLLLNRGFKQPTHPVLAPRRALRCCSNCNRSRGQHQRIRRSC